MAALTQQQVAAAYANAFPGGKNLNGAPVDQRAFLNYWTGKDDTKLRDALRADQYSGGVYKEYRDKQTNLAKSQINALYSKYYGRNATQSELDYYLKNGVSKLEANIQADNSSKKIAPTPAGQPLVKNPVNPGTTASPVTTTPPTTQTAAPPQPKVLTYDEWLKGPGNSYANAFSEGTINAQYDPYYNQLLGGLDYEKTQAQAALGRSTENTRINYGTSYNDAGLYGSGVYQKELGKALDELNRNYSDYYGSGEYTPYSLRKQEILQEQQVAKADAALNRQNQAFNVYQSQYYPLLSQQ
jgi:hypothetical protein